LEPTRRKPSTAYFQETAEFRASLDDHSSSNSKIASCIHAIESTSVAQPLRLADEASPVQLRLSPLRVEQVVANRTAKRATEAQVERHNRHENCKQEHSECHAQQESAKLLNWCCCAVRCICKQVANADLKHHVKGSKRVSCYYLHLMALERIANIPTPPPNVCNYNAENLKTFKCQPRQLAN
jgi:hypothetical protein